MRASSPGLVAIAATAIVCSLSASAATAAEAPIQITIHTAAEQPMFHPATAEVSADAGAVRAAMKAHAALALPEGVMGAAGALRAAREAGLEEGVAPWRAVLDFSWAYGTAVWRVTNTTSATIGNVTGHRLVIDARSGQLLGRDRWHAIVG